MASVKDSWKKVGSDFGDVKRDIGNSELGKDLGKLGKDLGKSIVKTVKHGVKAASEWADKDEPVVDAEEIPVEDGEVVDK